MGQTGVAFRELLAASDGMMPGELQRRAGQLLPSRVADSRMRWWTVGDPVQSHGRRLLIGVAVWSGYDLRLLDHVDVALTRRPPSDLVVDVFDTDVVRPPDLFEPYIPGLRDVYQTPVVGLWADGQLIQKGAGHAGRIIVAGLLGLNLAELSAFRPPVLTK